ncbi:protein of unknown function [Limnospira indica PCC 8005]|uniref:Uncharacterized protein n=1 Tax=Limnospira indica PCC 8005 TaxID=376219 RepID=A0A9P1KLI8_9CYAN|nr:protein of unknown function [Limnospira indica PCC 8005]
MMRGGFVTGDSLGIRVLSIRGREWSRLHPLPFKTGRETFTSSGS